MPYATSASRRLWPSYAFLRQPFRTRKAKKLRAPSAIVKEYLQDGSLHGVRYTVKADENIFSRIFWIIIVLISVTLAIYFILTAWETFRNSPVVTHVADTYYPLSELPFPSITVCPAYSIKKRIGTEILLKYVTDDLKDPDLNKSLFHLMRGLSFLRYPLYHLIPNEFQYVQNLTYYDKVDITDFMHKVLPTIDDLFDKCLWQGEERNCSEIFFMQRYEGGFCYSFNSQTTDICHENPHNCTILQSGAAGTGTGLEVHFRQLPEEDHLGIGPNDLKGLRVMVHESSQIPEPGIGLFMLDNAAKIGRVRVQPSITLSSQTLRSLSPEERNCYFADESSLTIAPEYSQDNCFIECRLLFIIKVCECQPYFFNFANDEYPECSILEFKCMVDNYKNLMLSRTLMQGNVIQTEDKINCASCLPSCDSVDYNIDSVFAEETKPIINQSLGYLNVYYEDQIAVLYARAPAVDTMNLLVSFGGIAGLFMGFSLLSIVEIIFYICKWINAMCRTYWPKPAVQPHGQPANELPKINHHYFENQVQQPWKRMRHNWALNYS